MDLVRHDIVALAAWAMIAGGSGHVVGYLDGANTWSGAQSVAAKIDAQQDFYLSGDISPTILAPNVADPTAAAFRITVMDSSFNSIDAS